MQHTKITLFVVVVVGANSYVSPCYDILMMRFWINVTLLHGEMKKVFVSLLWHAHVVFHRRSAPSIKIARGEGFLV